MNLKKSRAIFNVFGVIDLPSHGDGVSAAVKGTRSAWIRHYRMNAVLLEPLFVSNADQAKWIHNDNNIAALGRGIAEQILKTQSDTAIIGLSVGHLFKHSSPDDKGAPCALGDTEADHAQKLAEIVAKLLVPNQISGTHLEVKSKTHLIVKGETLYGIARQNNISISDLLVANKQITDPAQIITGDSIVIPLKAGLGSPLITVQPPIIKAGLPDTDSLTEQMKFDLYSSYLSKQGFHIESLEKSERIILGLRVTSSAAVNSNRGEYNDRAVIVWTEPNGKKKVKEFIFNTEPCNSYEDSAAYRRNKKKKGYGSDPDGNGWNDLGCLPDGLYQYYQSNSKHLGWVLKPKKDIYVVRDINHDGSFDETDKKMVKIEKELDSGYSILFHSGGRNATGSAGCQTMSPNQFNEFKSTIGNQQNISYALITVK